MSVVFPDYSSVIWVTILRKTVYDHFTKSLFNLPLFKFREVVGQKLEIFFILRKRSDRLFDCNFSSLTSVCEVIIAGAHVIIHPFRNSQKNTFK